MIYVSSSCSKQKNIGAAILELAEFGFQNIELSGGTKYYENYENDLFELKKKFNLNYLVHNYFPPQKDDFVLNLASLNDEIYEKSIVQLRNAICLSKMLGSEKFGFHAGFYADLRVDEIGKIISISELWDTDQANDRFYQGFNLIKNESNINIYIENNVYSKANYNLYGPENPFMLTSPDDYRKMKERIDFKLLFDTAHLYVSSKSLGFDFGSNLDQMIMETDYIHLSNNDGSLDQNKAFVSRSKLFNKIKKSQLKDKTITLEVYTGLAGLKSSYNLIDEFITH